MTVLAIDPGTNESAYVVWITDGTLGHGNIFAAGIEPNETLLRMLRFCEIDDLDVIAIEMVQCMGMIVGQEVFDTCVFIGRLMEHCRPPAQLVYRRHVKLHHCESARAKDSNIRQALIDKYGAPGTKREQGITYGLKSHIWQAFALATYISETAVTSSRAVESLSASFKSEDTTKASGISGVPFPGAEKLPTTT